MTQGVKVKCTNHTQRGKKDTLCLCLHKSQSLVLSLPLFLYLSLSLYLPLWLKTHLALRGRETACSRLEPLLVFRFFCLTLPLYTNFHSLHYVLSFLNIQDRITFLFDRSYCPVCFRRSQTSTCLNLSISISICLPMYALPTITCLIPLSLSLVV